METYSFNTLYNIIKIQYKEEKRNSQEKEKNNPELQTLSKMIKLYENPDLSTLKDIGNEIIENSYDKKQRVFSDEDFLYKHSYT